MKNTKKIVSLILAVCMIASLAISASVVVPTALPVAVGTDGTVSTATDAKIINNSFGAVKVANISIEAAQGWSLAAFGDKASLAHEKVNTMLPSAVDESVTLEVPVPPETSTVVGSAADAPMARLAMRQTARSRDTSFFMFFIVSSPFSFC